MIYGPESASRLRGKLRFRKIRCVPARRVRTSDYPFVLVGHDPTRLDKHIFQCSARCLVNYYSCLSSNWADLTFVAYAQYL